MFRRASVLVFLFALNLSAEPLFDAIQKNDSAAVKRLLARGADPNARDAGGTPALMTAVLFADAACVQALLDRGADPNAADRAGATALMWAIPDLAKVKLLLDRGAGVNARAPGLKRPPLLIAASYPGSAEVLRLLLSKGADIHAKDGSGMHALGKATLTGDASVVRFLVEHGCDPNEPGYGPTGPRRFARHDLESIEYLISKGVPVDKTALTFGATWQDPRLIEKWIGMGADVNAKATIYQRTALMTAASGEESSPALLRVLLEKGADPNAEDLEGERPLDWAVYRHDQDKIAVLEQFGAQPGKGPRHQTYPPPQAGGIADARTSLSRSLALLLPPATVVFRRRNCITCHSQTLPAQAAAAARRKGIAVNEDAEQANLSQILSVFKPGADAAMQAEEPPGNVIATGYVMAALAAERHPLDKTTAAFAHLIAGMQMPDGSWLGNGLARPPMEDSTVSHTAMSLHVLTLYPVPGARVEFEERLLHAQRWLLAVKPRTAEERNMRLMGLVWAGAPRTGIRAAIQEVLARQKPDGGWSQRDPLETDAYATGMSLYALHQAGLSAGDPAYRKGVAFLLRTQYQDGSWLVKTRAFPVQAYFESGYPFGHNQWISAAGASWASLAIAFTLPDAKPR